MEATEPGTRPYLVLLGFALLLACVFGGAFALGRTVGPASPGLRPGPAPSATGHSGGNDMPGTTGHDMTGHDMGPAR